MRVVVTREARHELREATRWYSARSPATGRQFIEAYRRARDLAAQAPTQWLEVEPGVRRVLLERFPYTLFYAVHGGQVVVLAIAHQKRRPRSWSDQG